jgi:hypothetical protein
VIEIDLIPARIRAARLTAARVRMWTLVCGGYLGFLVCVCAAVAAATDSEPTRLADRLNAQVKENENCKNQVSARTAQLQAKRRVLDANHAVGDQPDWSILLAMVANLTQDQVVLREFHFTPRPPPSGVPADSKGGDQGGGEDSGRFILKIKAFARTQEQVGAFVLRLEGDGLFEKVELIESKREAFGSGDAVGFSIECGIGPGGDAGRGGGGGPTR